MESLILVSSSLAGLEVKVHLEKLLKECKPLVAKKNLNFEGEFAIDGNDPFKPGYSSSVNIVMIEENGELIDLHIIKIWECERTLLGMPITKNLPGSKIIGSILDESLEEVEKELQDYLKLTF